MTDETSTLADATAQAAIHDPDRVAALRRLDLLGPAIDADFDRIARMAARLVGVPVGLVTLMAPERQWFKGRVGTELTNAPVETSFCAHVLPEGAAPTLVVEDANLDPRFSRMPLVVDPPHLRFYAGTAIVVFGRRVGSLCVLDVEPHAAPTEAQLSELRDLADIAASLFVAKDDARRGEVFKAALIREEKRHALALEAASIASWVWDLRSGVIECDPLLPRLFNLPERTRFPAADIYNAIDPRDLAKAESMLGEALSSNDDYAEEYRVRDVEPTRWLAGRGRVVERDPEGKPVLVFGVNFDVTEQKSAEEHQRLLLRELNHRVKNTLATVQAMATQTVRHSREPSEFLSAFGGRLHALGMAHGLLSEHEWRGIGLEQLIRLQVMPYVEAEQDRIHLDGTDIRLTPDQALAVGLILHELASNAVKYGSLSVPTGRVSLDWQTETRDEECWLEITWQEQGGPHVRTPDRTGFGSILIRRSLGKLLSSDVQHEFRPDGVYARISIVVDMSVANSI